MGYSFDGTAKVISLTAGTVAFDVPDLWSRWNDWRAAGNEQYPLAMRLVGGDDISDVKKLGVTFFMTEGWRIRPQEANHTLRVNGNLYTEPAGSSPLVSTLGAYNVMVEMTVSNLSDSSIQQLPQIEYASFHGGQGVVLDVVNGYSGVGGSGDLVGSDMKPSNNLPDALQIIANRGLPKNIFIKGNLAPSLSDNIAGYSFWGEDKSSTVLTLPAGTPTGISTIGTKMHDLTLVGTCRGRMDIIDCDMHDIVGLCATGGDAHITRCVLSNSIQLNSVADQAYHFIDCHSPAGVDALVLNANGCPADINFSNFNGPITIQNVANVLSNVSVGINTGRITIESTVSDAELVFLHGTAKFVNNSTLPAGKLDASGLLKPVDDQYGKRIYLSTAGSAGQEYPRGLFDSMVSNFPDALALADKYNCNDFHIHSDMTVPSGTVLDYFVNGGHIGHTLTFEAGCTTNNLKFENITLSGALNGPCEFHNCHLKNVSGVEGVLYNCTFEGAVTAKDGGMLHVTGGRSHTQTPVVLSVGTAMVNATNLFGVFTVANKTGAMEVSLHFGLGAVTVAASCTGGSIYLSGNGTRTGAGGGATVVDQMANPADMQDEALGKWVVDPTGNTLTLYKRDGTTVLKQFNLAQAGGAVPVYVSRTPA